VQLTGNRAELEKLDKLKLKPAIDVEGLKIGNYKKPLKLTLPETVKISEQYNIDIKVEGRK
jgi:YbbR domain-containing protein